MRRVNAVELRPVTLVLGSDEIGSAVAHALLGAGANVILIDEVDPPWPRRGMTFTDAWYFGVAELEQVSACFCASVRSIPALLNRPSLIAATTWSWQGVTKFLSPAALIDARMRGCLASSPVKGSLQAPVLTIGVGDGFVAGTDVDVVVEVATSECSGGTSASDDRAREDTVHTRSGDVDSTRVVCAPRAGRFQTQLAIGDSVEAGGIIGEIAGELVRAPTHGVLRGLSARGARVGAGCAIVEVDPRGDPKQCFGQSTRARRIGASVVARLAEGGVLAISA